MQLKLYAGVALAALVIPGAAYAQSTGTQVFEQGDIVVTGQREQQVGGTKIPDTVKTKVELTNRFLAHETAGQSVDETINMLPGVSFTNNDPYGSSGGTLTIRGFDASRISQTVDGIPVNDTGNYAIYSNQQIDPELIDQVNVSLGSTDIDSPTASASGSTVNYTTITPTDKFGARLEGSVGDLDMFRVFGLVNTGTFTSFGTKAWISASHQDYNVLYASRGKIDKNAYNAKVYQPFGSNGDFVAIAGNYNVNRNNNTPDFYLDSFPASKADREQVIARCQLATPVYESAAAPATTTDANYSDPDDATSCGTNYAESQNPSNTGSIRLTSLFHLTDNLILTVDPSFEYTKANGGSSAILGREGYGPGGLLGYLGNNYYFGEDLNGDGDMVDTGSTKVYKTDPDTGAVILDAKGNPVVLRTVQHGVELYAPSQTVTHRYLLTSSLLWNISDTQSVRLSYAHDYGRHRQTGEIGYLQQNGQTFEPFPINDPIVAGNGAVMEKRNRKSYAILDQVSGEYRGEFFGDKLTIDAGVRAPFFKRELNNYCFTTSAAGYVDCVAGDDADVAAYAAAHPYTFTPGVNGGAPTITGYAPPSSRNFSYHKILPSAGATYRFGGAFELYASYSRGLQVPGTDNLYNNFYYPKGFDAPVPEITDNFDGGFRYTSSKIQAQVGPWFTIFKNRLASSYDPLTDTTTYRNLGTVHRYGIDGSIAYQPVRPLSLYVFGSWKHSSIQDDILAGQCTQANVNSGANGCTAVNADYYYQTAGKQESGSPVWTLGGRVQVNVNPVEFGIEAKHTGKRYLNDQNVDLVYDGVNYGATAAGFTVVNLDARVNAGFLGLNDTTYVQFNVTNVFDALYINNFSSGLSASNDPFVYVSPPRTFSATLNVQF